MKSILFFLGIFLTVLLQAQEKKNVEVLRLGSPLSIDGVMDEPVYSTALPAKDFVQMMPYNGKPSKQPSEVYVFYDNTALYIGAVLYDSAPDSIFNLLSERDVVGMSDYFGVYIDPYNQGQLAYAFFITPSGVQTDSKAIKGDHDYEDSSWNTIWQSKTRITDHGWVVELKIPFSSLRFPENGGGTWGIQFFRNIRRYSSNNSWNFIDLKVSGIIHQSGQMTGIKDIKPPVRLSLSPFSAVYTQISPDSPADLKFKGGMDLKYGLSESFTLDMMLIPDFGQIRPDDKKLNLTPYELYYAERRQFFTEGTELFNRAGIFYSKRIGSSPKFTGKIGDDIRENELVKFSPSETQLLNATKISGRTENGWGLGFLNAITLPSYAVLMDTISDSGRKVLVQPLTNYNVSVIDKTLKNNSYVSLINTSMILANDPFLSNVTATDIQLWNKAKTITVRAKGGMSYRSQDNHKTGYFSALGIDKSRGKLTFGVSGTIFSDTYNPNDLGYLQRNNEFHSKLFARYIEREPFLIFKRVYQYIAWDHNRMYRNFSFSGNEIFLSNSCDFKNDFYFFSNLWLAADKNDYFEPRTSGRYYVDPRHYTLEAGLTSDTKKPFFIQVIHRTVNSKDAEKARGMYFYAGLRAGKQFQFNYSASFNNETNKPGFAGFSGSPDSIVFAGRDIRTVENAIGSSFTFNNRASTSLRIRHYVSSAENKDYFLLDEKGMLNSYPGYRDGHSQTYNSLNVDLLFRWIFAPGSELTLAWKKSVFDTRCETITRYSENFKNIMAADQADSFSIKVLYYLDYNTLRNKL